MMETQKWPSHRPLSAEKCPEKADEYMNNGSSFNNLLENVEGISNSQDIKNKNSDNQVKNVAEAAISDKSKKTIDKILEEVKTLTPVELLFLYLKLPTECSNSIDPLQKPLNPLGSRSEINQTIMWIKTHLEEDPELSLPKQDVYDEYRNFCEPNKIKPLSTADFGKVMKQVYANVRPRRLGTRGNSRYCYAGLRRRFKLEFPNLPELSEKLQSTEPPSSSADLFGAAWSIVKEWAESQLGTPFPSLHVLATYLVLNELVSQGSAAATIVTSVTKYQLKGDAPPSTNSSVCNTKHRETQIQLQRKIQHKCEGKEHKRKLATEPKSRSKKCKMQPNQQSNCTSSSSSNASNVSPTGTTAPPTTATAVVAAAAVANGVVIDANIQNTPEGLRPVCDKSQALLDFRCLQKSVVVEMSTTNDTMCDLSSDKVEKALSSENAASTSNYGTKENYLGKVPIPRISSSLNKVSPIVSPKRAKNAKYKMIQPKSEPCDITSYNPQKTGFGAVDDRSQESMNMNSGQCVSKTGSVDGGTNSTECKPKTTEIKSEEKIDPMCGVVDFPLTRERLISIGQVDKDALDDYLGTSNSQEHEEELMKYFENEHLEQEQSTKLSQLRQLLERNGHHAASKRDNAENVRINLMSLLNSSNQSAFTKNPSCKDAGDNNEVVIPIQAGQGLSARRRVSFDTVGHVEEAVPPSPSTRRKNFSFMPISPGPVSPGGRQSKSSSTSASPFVSPRNTPVPRAKNNLHQSSFVSGLPTNPVVQKKQTKLPLKIKQEIDFQLDPDKQLTISTNDPNYMAMSAPPSPKVKSRNTTNLLQQLLNAKGRVSYVPSDGVHIHNSLIAKFNEPLCTEVSQLLTGNHPEVASEVSFRSQSVPLHHMSHKSEMSLTSPLTPNGCITQFPFNVDHTNGSVSNTPIPNEFNDFDTFSSGADNINMNKILKELENEDVVSAEFGNIDNLALSIVDRDSFPLGFAQNGADLNSNLKAVTPLVPVVDIETALKYNPSRSVPGTPLPYCDSKTDLVVAKNYRSYPSTPHATTETFTYTTGHDYLLNGQPVKEKMEEGISPGYMTGPVVNQDIYTFNVAETGILLGDNKTEFNFEGQLSDSFGAKNDANPILGDNCVNIDSYGFRNVTE